MADHYRLIYESTGALPTKSVDVVATSLANAIAAAKTADSTHKQHVSGTVIAHNLIIGS